METIARKRMEINPEGLEAFAEGLVERWPRLAWLIVDRWLEAHGYRLVPAETAEELARLDRRAARYAQLRRGGQDERKGAVR